VVDTTMFFGERSGGIKRYLLAKRTWIRQHRADLRHTVIVPGRADRGDSAGLVEVASPPIPFSDGYRWPVGRRKWSDIIVEAKPDLIEAGDAFLPGRAAQEAGARCGAPVVGFCHTDPAALAGLHFGDWASAPMQARWGAFFNRFDEVIAPSRFIAGRLADAGVERVVVQPLGVDTDLFRPVPGARDSVRAELGLRAGERLLVFAGRAAREKNVALLVEALDLLGQPYRLLLIGAGTKFASHPRIAAVDFETDPRRLVRWLAGSDAFVHANEQEPFGLVALEALACGLPVIGPPTGGIAEIINEAVGQRATAATAAAFAKAIDAHFARDTQAVSLAARRKAETDYSWDGVFPRLLLLYSRLFAGSDDILPV
jgi:alpha-1,6-mannosyltransferase